MSTPDPTVKLIARVLLVSAAIILLFVAVIVAVFSYDAVGIPGVLIMTMLSYFFIRFLTTGLIKGKQEKDNGALPVDEQQLVITPEEWKRRQAEETEYFKRDAIKRARSVALPDGVLILVHCNNTQYHLSPKIDPCDVFSMYPSEVVEERVDRARSLLSSVWEVGDATVGKYPNLQEVKDQFIADNPGFSWESYDLAIHRACVMAR